MKERPILFSGPMVRALLDGSKTQTRRVMKKQPYISRTNPPQFSDVEVGDIFICPDYLPTTPVRSSVIVECKSIGTYHCMGQKEFAEKHSPYGVPGDHLWVRETAKCGYRSEQPPANTGRIGVDFKAGGGTDREYTLDRRDEYPWFPSRSHNADGTIRWTPGIHMPRWASRITLEITDVRIERLQNISEADAIDEGIRQHSERFGWVNECQLPDGKRHFDSSAYGMYRQLWDSLNAARGYGWDVNPWVWVIEFKRVTA
jgi:hypothetical protein